MWRNRQRNVGKPEAGGPQLLVGAGCPQWLPVGPPADSPVDELVLLQVLAALGDVSSYVEKVHHGQAGRMLLITQAESLNAGGGGTVWTNLAGGGGAHRPGSGLPHEGLQVSSGHQFQQDEPGHGLQTDPHTPHNVLVAELAAGHRCRLACFASCVPLAGEASDASHPT